MSTWTAPITWAATTLTSTQMNAEVRDHLNFLKGFADLITNATTADTGTATSLWIKRTNTTDLAYQSSQAGDTVARFTADASGLLSWGPGGASATDVTLKRATTGTLRLDGILGIYGTGAGLALTATQAGDASYRFSVLADGTTRWGDGTAAPDTNLYRSAANTLQTDDNLTLNGILALTMNNGLSLNGNGFVNFTEITEPALAGVNAARLYLVDNGSGKTQLRVRFQSGAGIVLATEV